MMKVLVTGANGFIGKNLLQILKKKRIDYYTFNRSDKLEKLENIICDVDCIIHLAGVMRPLHPNDFYIVSRELTDEMLKILKSHNLKTPIIFASSTQATLDNDYGKSKLEIEKKLINHSNETGSKIVIFRFTNTFGKWSRPNYNSVMANFCYNIPRDIHIFISDENKIVNFTYIDDVVDSIVAQVLSKEEHINIVYPTVTPILSISLKELSETLYAFKNKLKYYILNYKKMSRVYRNMLKNYCTYLPLNNLIETDSINYTTRWSFIQRCYHSERLLKVIHLKGDINCKIINTNNNETFYYASNNTIVNIILPPGFKLSIKGCAKAEIIILF